MMSIKSQTYSFGRAATFALLLSLGVACGGAKTDSNSGGSSGSEAGSGAGSGGSDSAGSGGGDGYAGAGGGAGSSTDAGADTDLDAGNTADASSDSGSGDAASGDAGCDAGDAGGTVLLGYSGDYVILAKTAISTVDPSVITGDVGAFPASSRFISGFALSPGFNGMFATSPQVSRKVYAGEHTTPTPSNLAAAVVDMQEAFANITERNPDSVNLGGGNLGGKTLAPGVYRWDGTVSIATNVTLEGDPQGIWIFQIAENLEVGSEADVVLADGAQAGNVFWQVTGTVTLDDNSHLNGTILARDSIRLRRGASVDGRLLTQAAVELAGNRVHDLIHYAP